MKENKKSLAKGIMKLANYTVENSVGKCFPALAHEVEMPESIRKQYLDKDIEEKN